MIVPRGIGPQADLDGGPYIWGVSTGIGGTEWALQKLSEEHDG